MTYIPKVGDKVKDQNEYNVLLVTGIVKDIVCYVNIQSHFKNKDYNVRYATLEDFIKMTKGWEMPKWIPVNGEDYIIPSIGTESGYTTMTYRNDALGDRYIHAGVACRTKEEALILRDKMCKAVK